MTLQILQSNMHLVMVFMNQWSVVFKCRLAKPPDGGYCISYFLVSSQLYVVFYKQQILNEALLILIVNWLFNLAA